MMASEAITDHHNMDYQLIAQIVDGLQKEQKTFNPNGKKMDMHKELRELKFWRWA
jgi:hypothetical protein